MANIDIALLILNAGYAFVGCPFYKMQDEQELENMVNTNVLQVTYLLKALLP